MTQLLPALRLLKARWFGPAIGEWSKHPVLRLAGDRWILWWRALNSDGTYRYRQLTADEEADQISRDAW